MQNTSSTVQKLRRAGDGRETTQCGKAVLKTRQHLERADEYPVRDRVCLSLGELFWAIETRGSRLSVEISYGRMLAEL